MKILRFAASMFDNVSLYEGREEISHRDASLDGWETRKEVPTIRSRLNRGEYPRLIREERALRSNMTGGRRR